VLEDVSDISEGDIPDIAEVDQPVEKVESPIKRYTIRYRISNVVVKINVVKRTTD